MSSVLHRVTHTDGVRDYTTVFVILCDPDAVPLLRSQRDDG